MIEKIMKMGFTSYEARIYVALLENGELNGYELSKITSIPKANVYSSLQSMLRKGYLFQVSENNGKYVAKGFDEISNSYLEEINSSISFLKDNLPTHPINLEKFFSITGSENILTKILHTIDECEHQLIIDFYAVDFELIEDGLRKAIKRGVDVYMIVMGEIEVENEMNAKMLIQSPINDSPAIRDINLVCDGEIAIAASVGNEYCEAIFSKNINFVNVVMEALTHDIILDEALKGCDDMHRNKIKKLVALFY